MSHPPDSAPTSLGWLAAHALDGADASPWKSAAFARAASEGLRSLAGGRQDPESEWKGFSRPFQAIADHVASIRDPLGTEKPPLAGIGDAAGAALRDSAAPKKEAISRNALAGIGGAIGDALQGKGSPFDRKAASWVETGNPSVRRASARATGAAAPAKPTGPAKTPQTGAKPTSKPAPAPSAPGIPPLSRADFPPAQSALEAWAEDLERKLKKARERNRMPVAAKPARKPFVYPEDPADLAKFKEILSRQTPGAPSAPGSPAAPTKPGPGNESVIPSDTVTPVAPPYPGLPAPTPGPAIGDAIQRLPPPGPSHSGSEGTDVFTPVQPPSRPNAPAPAPIAPAPSPRGPVSETPPAATPARPRASEMEWLEEEDDLAARLHSLLRRQARRRGVDLS